MHESAAACIPEDVVDGDDILFVDVLGVADDGRARLQPDVAAMTIHQTVIVGQHLALVQHCKPAIPKPQYGSSGSIGVLLGGYEGYAYPHSESGRYSTPHF